MKSISFILIIIFIISSAFTCNQQSSRSIQEKSEKLNFSKLEKKGYEKVTVRNYTGLDGCSYVLVLDSGQKLEPINLGEEYKKDSLNIAVKYIIRPDLASICMVGQIVEINDVKPEF